MTGEQSESVREEVKVEGAIFKVLEIPKTASSRIIRKTESLLPNDCSFIVPSL